MCMYLLIKTLGQIIFSRGLGFAFIDLLSLFIFSFAYKTSIKSKLVTVILDFALGYSAELLVALLATYSFLADSNIKEDFL